MQNVNNAKKYFYEAALSVTLWFSGERRLPGDCSLPCGKINPLKTLILYSSPG